MRKASLTKDTTILPKVHVSASGRKGSVSAKAAPPSEFSASTSDTVKQAEKALPLPNIRNKSPESLSLSYEKELRIETPKTEKAMFETGAYGMVDLRLPTKQQPSSPLTKTMRSPSKYKSLSFSLDMEERDNYDSSLFSQELSSFTLSHNQIVESCWDYLHQTPSSGAPMSSEQAKALFSSLSKKREAKESDVYDDIQSIISSMKCEEERQEIDIENAKKKDISKRKPKKTSSVRKQVDERLKILYHNPDELERLEKDISHYEKHAKEIEMERKAHSIYVQRNKKVPENFKEIRTQHLRQEVSFWNTNSNHLIFCSSKSVTKK